MKIQAHMAKKKMSTVMRLIIVFRIPGMEASFLIRIRNIDKSLSCSDIYLQKKKGHLC